MSGFRFGYTLLLYLLLPRVLLHLLWRARRQPGYLHRIPQRFGFYREEAPAPLLWVHAVSVGETRAAEPLVRALQHEYPSHRILLTHMTPTGWETGEQLFGGSVSRCYLPYDFPAAGARFLERFKPEFGVLLETELWPNLIHACRERDVPLYLVNARLSEKSYARYRRFGRLVRESLNELAAIAAQTRADAERLSALGARDIAVTGNLKFDVDPPAAQLERGRTWRASYGDRPVLLAASTRDGEEALLLARLEALALPAALLVIVPRHPQRFDEVARLIERHGVRWQRRSDNPDRIDGATRVLLGDSMGEMFAYYAACDVAFVGGSLLPFGGQNLIEACAAGKPVLFGPHTYNFSEAAESAVAAGAALRVADAEELMRTARKLLTDEKAGALMGEAGLRFSRMHRGATSRTLALLTAHDKADPTPTLTLPTSRARR